MGNNTTSFRMVKNFVLPVILLIIFSGCKSNIKSQEDDKAVSVLSESSREEILKTFMLTEKAWNQGDLDQFMKAYWNSDSLVFVGSRGATYGYLPTLESYKRGYPDTVTMGKLSYEIVDLRGIDCSTALMIGRFYLDREIGDMQGYYTLVWQKIEGTWVIVSDHSSGEPVSADTAK